jgi:protein-S-isoprenylcysteine O-methyltransferase Ste14
MHMRVRIGNWIFRYRNVVGPLVFLLALVVGTPSYPMGSSDWNIAFDVAGAFVALSGQALRILTIGFEYIERGGRDRKVYASKLVSSGVFSQCRNPLYVGNILITAGLALIVNSWVFYLLAVPFVVLSYVCIVSAEEAFLRDRFGSEYEDYCSRVRRWWPRWSGWTSALAGMSFNWRRVLVKEYNTFFLLLIALVGARLWSEYKVVGAVPRTDFIVIGLVVWIALYLLVRWMKRSSYIRA